MRTKDIPVAQQLEAACTSFHQTVHKLPGIAAANCKAAFIFQVLESLHRIQYVAAIRSRDVSPLRADPNSELFDPLKAAAYHQRHEEFNEAFWLVFLFVHFGKHKTTGWRLARDVYGRLGTGQNWDWASVSANPQAFSAWMAQHENVLLGDGIPRRFGNHRKYESLKAASVRPPGAVVQSYVDWVGQAHDHLALIDRALQSNHGNPKHAFAHLYRSMDVLSFGRTAKFDYLTMIGKLGLANIEPGTPYLQGATGPLSGAKLMFSGSTASNLNRSALEELVVKLGDHLGVGMQVMEDSLCNWQKSPNQLRPFRG